MAKSQYRNAYAGSSSYGSRLASAFNEEIKKRQQELYNADAIKKQQQDQPKSTSVGDKIGGAIKGVGNFVKDVAVGIKNDAVNTYTGLRDVAEGQQASHNLDQITQKQIELTQKHTQEMNSILGNAKDATQLTGDKKKQWEDFVKRSNKESADFEKKYGGQISQANQAIDTSSKVDAKKTAFSAASTFLNLVPVVGATGAAVKTLGVQAAKTMARDAVEHTIKTGGTDALEQIIKSGSQEAAKHTVDQLTKKVGADAAESMLKTAIKKVAPDSMFGAGYGALETGKNQDNASVSDYIRGATIGAVVGGAIPAVGAAASKVKSAINEKVTEKAAQEAVAKKAEQIIKMTPDQYAAEFGVTTDQAKQEIAKMAQDGTAIADTGIKAKVNDIFQPIKNLGSRTQAAFERNAGGRHVAEVRSRAIAQNLREAADASGQKLDFNLAQQIENGTAPKNAFTDKFRQIADQVRQEANDAGLSIGYRENYVPHIWKQSAEKVDKIARSAGMKARAEGERIVPTYEEGLKLGLKPKYKNPADMMADYVKNIETTRTNVALLTDLRNQGLLKAGKDIPQGWKHITADGFPKTAQGNAMQAPPEIARVLNNLYGKSESYIDKALRKTASFNSKWQDIALAGGIPHTPANFFTFSQMMKEGSLGLGQFVTGSPIKGAKTIYNPVSAFLRSFSSKETDKYFKANQPFIEQMAKRGVPMRFAESSAGRTSGQAVKDAFAWDKLFNEPTFGRFMPDLQLGTAKNVFNSLEKKIGREAALDQTAEIMKKMYGITDELATGRSQAVQDLIGTVGFAPKYRESIINVLANTVRSLNPKNFADKSYSLNRRLAVGLGVTYMIYDALNRASTGHSMAKNPSGKELQLAIPYGGKDSKGNQKVVYIPFMPSFMTIPRAIVGAGQAAVKGDVGGVAHEGGTMLSMPIQVISQLASNTDYFGRPITINAETARLTHQQQDTNLQALEKQGAYILGQASPAIPRAGINALQGMPGEQNAAQALELPVRFGKFSPKSDKNASYSPSQVTSDWYNIYNKVSNKRSVLSKQITSLVKQGKPAEARRKAKEFNDTLNHSFAPYYSKYKDNPTSDPMWNDMLNGLAISTSERSFKARYNQ